jgi:hypothetical protein
MARAFNDGLPVQHPKQTPYAPRICCLGLNAPKVSYHQACAITPSFGFFDRLDGLYRICKVQDGVSCLKSTIPTVQGGCHRTVRFYCNLAVWL